MKKMLPNTLMVDENNRSQDVVHFMMTKPIVLQIAKECVNNTTDTKTNDYFISFV
ncbi:MAG TPA: hypothetical protein VFG45_13200 [Candidatus Nitrosocosmicus sp.]|nr:hypothetical protein [Candidatus Nitrosocosmicus sp.]